MRRSFIQLFLSITVLFALYIFGKTKQYYLLYSPKHIEVREIEVRSFDSIMAQTDSVIIPISYSGSVDFRAIESEIRKEKFINFLLPSIIITRERLLDDLHHVEFIEDKIKTKRKVYPNDSLFLNSMKIKYKTDSIGELKKRIFPHPVSLALTQAVLESGWGTSSISRKGNNLFGIMSFSPDDSRLKIQFDDGEDDVYLRTYSNVIESVEHYFLMISRVSSYKKFRDKRWEGAPSTQLLKFLDSYHETDEYVELATSIIRNNQLTRYDVASIDPTYSRFVSLYTFLTQH